jgi:hypothetical protein
MTNTLTIYFDRENCEVELTVHYSEGECVTGSRDVPDYYYENDIDTVTDEFGNDLTKWATDVFTVDELTDRNLITIK